MTRLAAVVAAALALAGVARAADVAPLTLTSAKTPRFAVARYDTTGTYPQFGGADGANAWFRALVLDDQRKYAVTARRVAGWLSPSFKGRGVYETGVVPLLVSGSTEVASALFPVRDVYPGGSDDDRWLSLTVELPTGRLVEVGDLFAKPAGGLAKLAAAARSRLLATDPCVARGSRKLLADGTRPTAENLTHFALTPAGLAVGFKAGQVADPACGRVQATVPYAALAPSLGPLGKRLVAGVRAPRR